MAGTFLKWLIPGLVTVVGGTALAVAQTSGAVTADLSNRATAALGTTDLGWASVRIDGRDAILSGTATTEAMIDDAAARVSTVRGIRAVTSDVRLAEFVTPFPFNASIKGGAITLTGGFPTDDVHSALLTDAGTATDQTRLLSGGPDASAFESAATFGLSALKQLDQGEIRLADLNLSIEGRAKSPEAFDALQTLQQSVPAGVTLAALTVTPPAASPYIWTATFDGASVTITGDIPTPDLADKLRAAAPSEVAVSTTLSLASGEPSGFADNALTLFKTLLLLENGSATISDGTVTVTGAPATIAVADQVTAAVTSLGGTVTLEPPRVDDFTLSLDKTANALTFAGVVPDPATRDRLAAMQGADVSKLTLARGAPDRFASALDFGLAAIAHLTDGHFSLDGGTLTLSGRAATVADFKDLTSMAGEGAPQGLTLTVTDLHPPVAKPFTWSATRQASGAIDLAGYVPNDTVRTALHAAIAQPGADSADPADGAPDTFADNAGKGLDVLAQLDSGSVHYDGSNWTIDGAVDTMTKARAAQAAFDAAGLTGWTYNVHTPAQNLPIISPYVWRAQKTADGSISFSGFAPSDEFKTALQTLVPNAADSAVLGAGAPDEFEQSATAGLDALMALDEGSLAVAGTRWSLTGEAADATTRAAIQQSLSGKISPQNWQVSIQARDAAPIVTPYLWSAAKTADGTVDLSGYVPNDSLKGFATARAGKLGRDTTSIASGEPAGFSDDLLAGLDALSHMTSGKAVFDGSKWQLTGEVASDEQGAAATAALAAGSKSGTLWTAAITGYPAAAFSSEPAALDSSSAPVAADVISLAPPASSSSEAPLSVELSSSAEASSVEPSSSQPASSSSEPPSSEATPASSEPATEPSVPASSEPSAEPSSAEPATDRDVAPTALEATPPMPDTLTFEASFARGARITLRGAVPDAAVAGYLGSLAGAAATDTLALSPALPADFVANAQGGINALKLLSEGRVGFDGTRWWLRGKAEQQVSKDTAAALIAALPKGADWSVAISLLAPLDVCTVRVDTLAKRNAILFTSGSATLTATSMPVLDELAGDLEICPEAYVHVQGHTDSDGAEDINLGLSVSRAEAVVTALIERGVSESRLYAEGYGESEPIASNDTKQGKAQNRRIAFSITEE